jgi:glucokinase
MTNGTKILGIDLGGTNIRIGLVENNKISEIRSIPTPSNDSQKAVLDSIAKLIKTFDSKIDAIGIGVPSIVDVEAGIVYEVVNIPQWKEVHLKSYLESVFHVPVFVNNDANCFAVGEKYYGKGIGYKSVAGLVLGTGLGAGLIFNNQLYEGKNCGAGEIGNISYLSHNYEYYCSGQFFKDEYQISALEASKLAINGNHAAIEMFNQFGTHVGNMIQLVLFAYDPEIILLGGSLSKSFVLFRNSMNETISHFLYQKTLQSIKIEVSEIENVAIYGAASLYFNNLINNIK